MTWSLGLRNGDLIIDENRMGAITGWQKLVQDLRCHILEKVGTDPSNPNFGSTLDGGTRNGQEIDGVIGRTDIPLVRATVETEINRIVREHQTKQLDRIRSDRQRYGTSTFTQGEMLEGATVNIAVQADMMVVQIILRAGSGERQIAIPFEIV